MRTGKGKDARGKKAAKRARKQGVAGKMMARVKVVVAAKVVRVYETGNADGESESIRSPPRCSADSSAATRVSFLDCVRPTRASWRWRTI